MKFIRIHILAAAFLMVVCLVSVDSSIENSPASSVSKTKSLKGLDDLYIDDEDEIQLADEASGSGPLKKPTRIEEDEDEDEEEEEEEEDEDDDVSPPVVVPVEKPKADPIVPVVSSTSRSSTVSEDEVVVPPKVSPVAAPPSRANPAPVVDDDDDDDDDDFEVQGSGEGSGSSGRVSGGAGSSSSVDEEDEDDYEDPNTDDEVEGIDINSVITEPEPKVPSKPERKPDVVVVAPPTTPSKSVEVGPSPPPPQVTQPPPPPPVEVSTTNPPDDVHIHDHTAEDRQASFFAQPGILAAVIGGAVVGLLCAILLVMFIVYRMRKKDEGSYVLDEPKRTSPSSHPYNKNSREFYA